jgi:hypothetical protein
MSNPNSIADVILRQNNNVPLTIASAGTLHQSFNLANGTQALCTIPNPMALIDSAELFPPRAASALPFLVRAGGTVVGGERYQIDIVQGTGLVNVVASTGLAINGLTADNWLIEMECQWDPTSLYLRGIYYGWAGNQGINQTSLVSSVQPANLAALQFNVALTLANANVNAAVFVTEFSAELL